MIAHKDCSYTLLLYIINVEKLKVKSEKFTKKLTFSTKKWRNFLSELNKLCVLCVGACCAKVEDALDVTMAQRAELDYLIYNDLLGYADLILNGDPEEYLKNVAGSHGLED